MNWIYLFSLGKAFEKQIKIIEDQRKKQIDAVENLFRISLMTNFQCKEKFRINC